ncbi:DNA alkylation repair protein [Marinicella litoralis]|uniref:3-methyladenine DNA glycosylase AlkD n=1 Tax=Marinicella litoralis TaxID=644220 RepID=A0A4R6XLK3_9GAMM|nr:DNA alkylation repair protein [Marinicella litoralis]TDR20446.1 3-methyladenine DNA glycosylase AlkD [Marinicella litoralis]
MDIQHALKSLEALGDEKVREQNRKKGAGTLQYGVRLGDIRKLAKQIKTNHELATALWQTENTDAQLLAILLFKPKVLATATLDQMVRSTTFDQVADWLSAYIIKKHPDKETLRQQWMADKHPMAARAGWSLTYERVEKAPEGLDIRALLNRIEAEMSQAQPAVQWTMNFVLAGIGINFPEFRDRALQIGEDLGVYRDYPVSKGCTSPFAPAWINEMVSRQQQ